MDRVRIALGSLLPALWLVAAGHCLADSVSGRADACRPTTVSAADHGGQPPLTDAHASEQWARLMHRRGGMHSGWIVDLLPPPAWRGELHTLVDWSVLPTVSSEALGLAKCWQFYWRTALEPRAPSAVS
jgi:hypothetical protein